MKNYKYNYENKTNLRRKNKTTLDDEMYKTNIPDLLELIHFTDDIALLTKAFYSLGFYLLSQESGCDHIIKCRFLYDKILLVLNCCLQSKVSVALDFISSLLLFGDDKSYSRKQTLHIYAQNMIKTSGCLAAMCNLFTNCMMQRGPLWSLCVSLSVAVRMSQTACAHLVPMCISKCSQEHVEVFLLLQSLLSGNDRNVQLFHECNGMSIFTKESLQYPECLFLLNTIVESAGQENIAILNKSPQFFDIIESFLLKYGSQSILGQWASIILYSKRKAGIGLERDIPHSNRLRDKTDKINVEGKSSFAHNDIDTVQLFRNVYKEIITLQEENPLVIDKGPYKEILAHNIKPVKRCLTKGNFKNDVSFSHPIERTVRNKRPIDLSFSFLRKMNETCVNVKNIRDIDNDNRHSLYDLDDRVDRNYNTETRTQRKSQYHLNETNRCEYDNINTSFGLKQSEDTNFIRKVRNPREVQLSLKEINRIQSENLRPSVDLEQSWYRNFITKTPTPRDIQLSYRSETNRIKCNDFNPSFGLQQKHFVKNMEISREIRLPVVNEIDQIQSDNFNPYFGLRESNRFNESDRNFNIINNTILEFKPPFVSTPKYKRRRQNRTHSSSFCFTSNPATSSIRKVKLTRNNQCYKRKLNMTTSGRNQNKSMSAKFFDLINGSCTTLVKSFTNIKNIFKRKTSEDTQDKTVTVNDSESNTSRSYSFTNYMQERAEKYMLNMESYEKTINCITCNDTEVLKQKMESDRTLQRTVKRLKLGINLYGCDFKRISRTMWPRDTYMTPSVLYNLYRKLIVK